MPDYQFLDGTLRSDLSLPELPASRGRPVRWRLTRSPALRPPLHPVTLGSELVEPGVAVSLVRHDAGLRLIFDDTGSFDISPGGEVIAWDPPEAPDLEAVRKDVLGRVIAVALHLQRSLVLHGSAVDLGGPAVAFLAPKFHGKSTTAAALVERGARLLADDLVVLSDTDPPNVLPTMSVVQLWEDSALQVPAASPRRPEARGPGKVQHRWTDPCRYATDPAPLAAIYLLAPRRPGDDAGVARQALPGVEATLALLGQAKVGALLGVAERADLLDSFGILADRVPVYRLDVPRDFDRLEELTSTIEGWHADHARPDGEQ